MKTAIYIVPYKVNGIQIPARIQVTLARNYLNDINENFEMPKTENFVDKSLPVFKSIIQQKYQLVVMYSHLMLATDEGLDLLKQEANQKSLEKKMFYFTFSRKLMGTETVLNEVKSKLRHNRFGFHGQIRSHYSR